MNSPLDADKIDYIFRDAKLAKTPISLDSKEFIETINKGISITPENFLLLDESSTIAMHNLLENRAHLYKQLYLRPELRFLEAATKYILKTFLVHAMKYELLSNTLSHYGQIPNSDTGRLKILTTINIIENIYKNLGEEDNAEIAILTHSVEMLRKSKIDEKILGSIEMAYKLVTNTEGENQLAKLKRRMLHEYRETYSSKKKDFIYAVSKTVHLRFPGSLLIDIASDPKYLSIAEKRDYHNRSDGTYEYSECMLVTEKNKIKPIQKSFIKDGEPTKTMNISIWRLCDDTNEANLAFDAFKRLMEKEETLFEVE